MKKSLVAKLLTICVIMLAASPAFAVNWVRIGKGHYIDADSIRRSDSYGTYTFNTRYSGETQPLEEINGKDVWTINTNSYIDCRNAYAKTISYTTLDKNYNVISRGKNIRKQWFNVDNPGTPANDSYLFVCTDKYLNKYPYYNRAWYY